MKTKYALVLSGGGFKGAFQVGALKYLAENWKKITGRKTPMKFDIIAGVSAGSINGAMIAMNQQELLEELWRSIGVNGASEIYTSEFIDTDSNEDKIRYKFDVHSLAKRLSLRVELDVNFFRKIGMIFSREKRRELLREMIGKLGEAVKANYRNFRSVASNSPLRDKLRTYLDRSKIKGTTFTAGFVSLNTGTYHSVRHSEFAGDEDFVNGVLASTAIPMVWEPVDKVNYYRNGELVNTHNNVDGGIMNVSPLGDVIKLINEDRDNCRYKVIIINCNSGVPTYEAFSNKSIAAIAARSVYELTLTEIFNNDLQHFLRINELVKQAAAAGMTLRHPSGTPIKAFDVMTIGPDPSVDLGSALVANERLIEQRIAEGYSRAAGVQTFE